jgi:hypothetical protein
MFEVGIDAKNLGNLLKLYDLVIGCPLLKLQLL